MIRLQTLVDGDGRTNTVNYVSANSYSTNLIAGIVDAFGRTNYLVYDNSGHLTNSTDVAGISTSFIYDGNDWVTNMTTPYGTTSFILTDSTGTNIAPNGRSVLVTQPDGSHKLYLYTNSAAGIASSYPTNQIPATTPYTNTLDTNNLDLRNSFYWGPRQYEALSTNYIGAFTTNDFRKARMQHWLQAPVYPAMVGQTVSMVRKPSPDSGGFMEGQKIWYDYAGKTDPASEGSQPLPLFIAQVLPDGTSSLVRNDHNSLGNVLTNVTTYSSGTNVALRTNIFTYDASLGIDLITATNALGLQVSSNAYNAYHEVLTNYDALHQRTVFTYNASQQLLTVASPSGLICTNIYESDGHIATNYCYAVTGGGTVYFGTNSFTYTNDLVYTHTDARGLCTTNTWDNLQRLTGVTFPDGTYISNQYTVLDLGAMKDRLGNWTQLQYDPMRHLISKTNALTNATLYTYCSCGALESVQDALNNTTSYYYNNAGWLTNTVYPAGYCFTNNYDLLGRLTNSVDSAGSSLTNWINNHGLKYAVSNYFGRVQFVYYDKLDRITTNIDANGVTVTNTYDNLNRILTTGYPDGGTQNHFRFTLQTDWWHTPTN